MENNSPARTTLASVGSWAVFLAALACLGFTAWYIPADRRSYESMFRAFSMDLPRATQLLLAIPDIAFPIVAALLAIATIGAQWRIRTRSSAVVFHMMMVMLCCIAIVVYLELLFQPMAVLLHSISTTGTGK